MRGWESHHRADRHAEAEKLVNVDNQMRKGCRDSAWCLSACLPPTPDLGRQDRRQALSLQHSHDRSWLV